MSSFVNFFLVFSRFFFLLLYIELLEALLLTPIVVGVPFNKLEVDPVLNATGDALL